MVGHRRRPLRWMCAGDPGRGVGPARVEPAPLPTGLLLVGGWILLVAQVGVVGVGGGAGAGDDFLHRGQGVAVGGEESQVVTAGNTVPVGDAVVAGLADRCGGIVNLSQPNWPM